MIKSICIKCRSGHSYYCKELPKNTRWCCNYCKLVKNKRGCIDFEEKKESLARRIYDKNIGIWKVSKFASKKNS